MIEDRSGFEENLMADIEELERQLDRKNDRIDALRAALEEAHEYMEAVLPDTDERLLTVCNALGIPVSSP